MTSSAASARAGRGWRLSGDRDIGVALYASGAKAGASQSAAGVRRGRRSVRPRRSGGAHGRPRLRSPQRRYAVYRGRTRSLATGGSGPTGLRRTP